MNKVYGVRIGSRCVLRLHPFAWIITPMVNISFQDKQITAGWLAFSMKLAWGTTRGPGMEGTLGWQPIETAPRDGTEVFVAVFIATVFIVRSAAFVKASEWSDPDSDDCDGWWSYRNSVGQELLEGIYEPAYWMQMPEYPP